MDHVAIMKKSLGYLPKIISGEKTIESRWYRKRIAPWGKVKKGDAVYFQDSGNPVTVISKVAEVVQFENLTNQKILTILKTYGERLGISEAEKFFKNLKGKNYCILIFLENVREITPFFVNKSGFGSMSAWICVNNIDQIKR